MSLYVLGSSQTADVVSHAWKLRGHSVYRQRIGRHGAMTVVESIQEMRPAVDAYVWVDEPLPPRLCASLAQMAGGSIFIDMGWVVRPLQTPNEHRALIAQTVAAAAASRRYVPCVVPALAQPGAASSVAAALPAILVCCDEPGPKAFARELLGEIGRRTFDTGPLQSLRYLDPSTLRMFADA